MADGTLLRRSFFDIDDNEVQRIDYQGEFLFVNNQLDKIFTEEGFYSPISLQSGGTSSPPSGGAGGGNTNGKYYYTLTDHLGHTRVVVDEDENVVQETAYYPYGTPIAALSSETKYNYLYTGKEFIDNLGVNWYDHHARYYDPEVGRWWAIAPALQGASPYMAMGNNPMMMIDEDGEFAFLAALAIGAAIGAGSYTASIAFSKGGFDNWNWGGLFQSAGIGAVSGVATAGIGNALNGMSGIGTEALRAGMHGVTQGGLSELQGGSFKNGFASGALSSLTTSAIQEIRMK